MKKHLLLTLNHPDGMKDREFVFTDRNWVGKLHAKKDVNQDQITGVPQEISFKLLEQSRTIEDEILPYLTSLLNKAHDEDMSARAWKIILGHWVRMFSQAYVYRKYRIEELLKDHDFESAFIDAKYQRNYAPMHMEEAQERMNDWRWDSYFTAKILESIGWDGSIDAIPSFENIPAPSFKVIPLPALRIRLGAKVILMLEQITMLLPKPKKIMVTNSYLPIRMESFLQISFFQFPRMHRIILPNDIPETDTLLREELKRKALLDFDTDNIHPVLPLCIESLPRIYLEGFKELKNLAEKVKYPSNPKLIFTSNNFRTDEVFKFWTAKMIDSGTKYIVGQHGNNYGTNLFLSPSIEESTADYFLTWGWSGRKTEIPTFLLKDPKPNKLSYSKKGGLLLVETVREPQIHCWDTRSDFEINCSQQRKFIENIHSNILSSTTVRMARGADIEDAETLGRIFRNYPQIKVDLGFLPIKKLIKKNRLVVQTYDSTGLLENLSNNVPTIAFWRHGFDRLAEEAQLFYQTLVDAEILFFDPEEAARKINDVWDDIDSWWLNSDLQEIRKIFCAKYAVKQRHPIAKIRRELLALADEASVTC
ncbi:Putative transferase, LIC12162 family [Candidatus Nanopelagicaceae bacterium]